MLHCRTATKEANARGVNRSTALASLAAASACVAGLCVLAVIRFGNSQLALRSGSLQPAAWSCWKCAVACATLPFCSVSGSVLR